ncbi:hypothetical protein K437DRAFT_22517 [Tilletiaria anomala UBC 951]|uniref:Uncharacterized protein n=1 Tax=Tilletiaria anomala (strain ATCC 24038 / CBS 436.72 / UBC 951) TaxID=1037660 RepID=A0A066VE45_TILAU|nr:uncharacterized protein K437DRAFT_22517 [Tilletiaria anomala UBC 951]KDN38578.1 hypothetical protein K437DRAFT_22517 [Tilletiaria anomala UBC 951]
MRSRGPTPSPPLYNPTRCAHAASRADSPRPCPHKLTGLARQSKPTASRAHETRRAAGFCLLCLSLAPLEAKARSRLAFALDRRLGQTVRTCSNLHSSESLPTTSRVIASRSRRRTTFRSFRFDRPGSVTQRRLESRANIHYITRQVCAAALTLTALATARQFITLLACDNPLATSPTPLQT